MNLFTLLLIIKKVLNNKIQIHTDKSHTGI